MHKLTSIVKFVYKFIVINVYELAVYLAGTTKIRQQYITVK